MMRQFILLAIFTSLFITGCAQDSEPQVSAGATDESAAANNSASAEASSIVGDAAAGKRVYIFCQSCHSINEGGANKVGPNLYGVFGRQAAKGKGFVYSDALNSADITWTAATLDQWLERPGALVPGTTMVFAGINKPQQRADLIAYLESASGAAN
jgi:cytochrome c